MNNDRTTLEVPCELNDEELSSVSAGKLDLFLKMDGSKAN